MRVVFLLFVLLGAISARAAEPADAAIAWLEKVRLGTVNLEAGTDTAISAYTSEAKRKEILRRLERYADELGRGGLQAADVRTEGDLAGVLVRDSGGYDPSRMRVYGVALVKRKDQWLPAPLPSSFENTGAGLSRERREKVATLESWLLGAQITELERLRDDAQQRMRREISGALDPSLLRSDDPEKVSDAFLAACRERNLPAILGFLGGLQEKPPADWADRLRSADAAISAGRQVGWPWRLVMAGEVIRVPVSDGGEDSGSLFSFACLDPAGRGERSVNPSVEILHIDLTKSEEGLWKVNLPPAFLLKPGEEMDESEDDFVQDLLDAFPAGVRTQVPAKPRATLAEAAAALDEALRADSLRPFLSLIDLDGDPGTASRGCALAAKAWWTLHNPEAPRFPMPLGSHESGNAGIASFQFFSPREPAALDIRSFHFEKTGAGWLLLPGMKLTNSPTESQIAARAWAEDRAKTWRLNWQSTFLAACAKLEQIPADGAPSEEEAASLVARWLAATHEGDIGSMLGMIAVVNRQGEAHRTLQSIGFEISTALRDHGKVSTIFTERTGPWVAVGVKSQAGATATHPLYLVVPTPAGPRLLIAADLFGDTTSGRDRLNETVLRRMKDYTPEPALRQLRDLIPKFRSVIPR